MTTPNCMLPWSAELSGAAENIRALLTSMPQLNYKLVQSDVFFASAGSVAFSFVLSGARQLPLPQSNEPNPFWPDEAASLLSQKGFVSINCLADNLTPAEYKKVSQLLGQIVRCLTVSADALGVLWSPAGQLYPAAYYNAKYDDAISKSRDPIDLWIGVRLATARPRDGSPPFPVALTQDLNSFIGRELDVVGPPSMSLSSIWDTTLQIAQHLIDTGDSLKEGEVMQSADQSISFKVSVTESSPHTGKRSYILKQIRL